MITYTPEEHAIVNRYCALSAERDGAYWAAESDEGLTKEQYERLLVVERLIDDLYERLPQSLRDHWDNGGEGWGED